jgi:hypothetical protein
MSGPGTVTFGQPEMPQTTAEFSAAGEYVLRLTASDGSQDVHDEVRIVAGSDPFEAWQRRHFNEEQLADPNISGADADPDGDGHTNSEEYTAETLPLDPDSVLRLLGVDRRDGSPEDYWVRFTVVADRSYTVQYRDGLDPAGEWQRLGDAVAGAGAEELEVQDPNPSVDSPRFYRVMTPALP